MSKFTLDDILNAVSIPLEIDGVGFRLVPMSSRAIAAWNRVMFEEPKPGEDGKVTLEARLDHADKQRDKQLQLLADHMRASVTSGDAKKVTAKWLGDAVPQVVLQDLAEFFVEGKRPAWAEGVASGN